MLHAMRNFAQTRFVKTFFVLLLASFALWGVGPIFTSGRVQDAAKAGDVAITQQDVDQALQRQVRAMEQQYGFPISSEAIAAMGMKRQVAQQLVMQALYAQEARKMGVYIGMPLVKQTIATQPTLRDEQGKFSREQFRAMLERLGVNEGIYIKMLQSDLTRTILLSGLKASVAVPHMMAEKSYLWQNEKRVASVALFNPADKKDLPVATAEQLKAYYQDHTADYMDAEYRDISLILVRVADLEKAITPTEAELKAAYEADSAAYNTPEKRTLLQVTTQDKAVAEAIAAAAAQGSLADAAKAQKLNATEVKDVSNGDLIPEIAKPVFALEPQKSSGVVQSPLGYHVMVVTKVTPASAHSYDAVKAQLTAQTRRKMAETKMYDLAKQAQDSIASGAKMDEVAKTLGLEVISVKAVNAEGKTADGKVADVFTLWPEALQSAFAATQGSLTNVQEGASGIFALQVEAITPAQAKPFDTVKEAVQKAWNTAKADELTLAAANDAAKAWREGKAPAATKQTEALERSGKNRQALPEAVVAAVFNAKRGDVVVVSAAGKHYLAKVSDVVQARAEGADLTAQTNQLKNQLGDDLLEQYGAALRTHYGATLNEEWFAQK